ncbi:MAG: heavy metal-responsive transcriptional regulator [Gammaproteobacteria bacterium]|nr:heavy metal-responsive transcriptional regulator [Gammaproteobacteria bacterium]
MPLYSIGEVARRMELSADTLRYYEKIGLLPKVSRTGAGIRRYDEEDLSRLNFIKRAQRMNFSLQEIKNLLIMRNNPQRAKTGIRKMTAEKLADIDNHLQELGRLRNELQLLLNLCQGSAAGCPIIETLEEPS